MIVAIIYAGRDVSKDKEKRSLQQPPEMVIAALIAGKSRDEQKTLLANLERRGAVLYRVLSLYVS